MYCGRWHGKNKDEPMSTLGLKARGLKQESRDNEHKTFTSGNHLIPDTLM